MTEAVENKISIKNLPTNFIFGWILVILVGLFWLGGLLKEES